MKKNITYRFLIIYCCLLLMACNSTTPEKYFSIAVLNSNVVYGFADDGQLRQLESPSVMLEEGSNQVVPMKRSKVIMDKIGYLEENLQKLKNLKETADTKEILQNGIALYEYVLPVYKSDYVKLAALYDEGAPQEKIQAKAKAIHDQHYLQYRQLSDKLISDGKLYADRHSIKVNVVNPSPN